jgi:hypothetical protein
MAEAIRIGDITVHRIVEQETPFLPALEIIPALTPERLAENRDWMAPTALDPNGWLIMCFQSYALRAPHHVILVDSCISTRRLRQGSRPRGCGSRTSISSCAPISTPTMSAGTPAWKTAAGSRPSRTPDQSRMRYTPHYA